MPDPKHKDPVQEQQHHQQDKARPPLTFYSLKDYLVSLILNGILNEGGHTNKQLLLHALNVIILDIGQLCKKEEKSMFFLKVDSLFHAVTYESVIASEGSQDDEEEVLRGHRTSTSTHSPLEMTEDSGMTIVEGLRIAVDTVGGEGLGTGGGMMISGGGLMIVDPRMGRGEGTGRPLVMRPLVTPPLLRDHAYSCNLAASQLRMPRPRVEAVVVYLEVPVRWTLPRGSRRLRSG